MADHPWGAVVLTGGTGSRLGGADKAALLIDGEPLLARALAATAAAAEVVVVGERTPSTRPVVWAREDPPGGGPAAGLLAGVGRLSPACELVGVLAVDMPRVTPATFTRLVAALTDSGAPAGSPAGSGEAAEEGARLEGTAYDGAVLVDATGHRQPLCAVYRRAALASAHAAGQGGASTQGLSMRRLVAPLRLAEVAATAAEAWDVDTWEDLERVQRGWGC